MKDVVLEALQNAQALAPCTLYAEAIAAYQARQPAPRTITPELLTKLQTTTEGGAILCANYVGGYTLLTEIYDCIVKHEGMR